MITTKECLYNSIKVDCLRTDEYIRLVQLIKPLYLWFAPQSSDEDIRKRLYQHTNTFIDLSFNEETGVCTGFSVYYVETFEGHEVMFRGGTVVGDRSQGIYKRLLSNGIARTEPDFLVAMTQNPRVYESLRSYSSDQTIYPSYTEVPQHIQRIARKFGPITLDEESLIVRDIYHNIRCDESFKTARDENVTRLFKQHLGVRDAFLVVVDVRH